MSVDAIPFDDHVADVDPRTEQHPLLHGLRSRTLYQFALDLDSALDGPHHARELGEEVVPGSVHHAAAAAFDHAAHDLVGRRELPHGARVVTGHETAVADRVDGKDGREPSLLAPLRRPGFH
jgi:hypothetical protein